MGNEHPFSGEDYSKEPFTDAEWAEHRHMKNKVADAWPTVSTMDQIAKGGKALGRLIAVMAILGATAAWAVNMGFFG